MLNYTYDNTEELISDVEDGLEKLSWNKRIQR